MNEEGKSDDNDDCICSVAHVLFLTPIGIMNFYSRFFLGRKCHPCKISVYVFQKLSSFMAQTYCAINPWL